MQSLKFFTTCFLVLASPFAADLNAQVDVTVNPFYFILKGYDISAEAAISPKFGIEAEVGKLSVRDDDFEWDHFQITAYGKYYFISEKGPQGFHADIFARYVSRDKMEIGSLDVVEYSDERAAIGLGIGYKAMVTKHILLDIGLAAGHAFYDNGEKRYVTFPRLMPVASFGIGYRFGGR